MAQETEDQVERAVIAQHDTRKQEGIELGEAPFVLFEERKNLRELLALEMPAAELQAHQRPSRLAHPAQDIRRGIPREHGDRTSFRRQRFSFGHE